MRGYTVFNVRIFFSNSLAIHLFNSPLQFTANERDSLADMIVASICRVLEVSAVLSLLFSSACHLERTINMQNGTVFFLFLFSICFEWACQDFYLLKANLGPLCSSSH